LTKQEWLDKDKRASLFVQNFSDEEKKAIDELEYLFSVSIHKLFLAQVIKITGPYFTL
jgi:hypothetical protein